MRGALLLFGAPVSVYTFEMHPHLAVHCYMHTVKGCQMDDRVGCVKLDFH
jgi:hypothetical protein